MTFEEAIKQLEEIAEKIEKGNCTLDESIALYEKAMELTKICDTALKTAKLKITQLSEIKEAEEN